MVPNNFQIELKGLLIATSHFTGVKHVTHRETGWENSGSKETGLEYDGLIIYVHFLNLGNMELETYITYIFIYHMLQCLMGIISGFQSYRNSMGFPSHFSSARCVF